MLIFSANVSELMTKIKNNNDNTLEFILKKRLPWGTEIFQTNDGDYYIYIVSAISKSYAERLREKLLITLLNETIYKKSCRNNHKLRFIVKESIHRIRVSYSSSNNF